MKQKQKKYYEENKEEIAKNSLEKIKCECGEYYTKKHKTQTRKKSITSRHYNDEWTRLMRINK